MLQSSFYMAFTARNYSTGLWKDLSENGFCGTLVGKRSGEEIAAIEAAKILKELSDEDLVLEHLGWVRFSGKELVYLITSVLLLNFICRWQTLIKI